MHHERFAHQDKRHVKRILDRMKVTYENDKNEFCDGCALGKTHRLPYRSRKDHAKVPGEAIHADVCGPMQTVSEGGFRYYVCFKDEYSEFRRFFLLKQKSEVKSALQQFMNEARTNGNVIKKFRCDGAKEFNNREVAAILATNGGAAYRGSRKIHAQLEWTGPISVG